MIPQLILNLGEPFEKKEDYMIEKDDAFYRP
jgi:hypothetical protein